MLRRGASKKVVAVKTLARSTPLPHDAGGDLARSSSAISLSETAEDLPLPQASPVPFLSPIPPESPWLDAHDGATSEFPDKSVTAPNGTLTMDSDTSTPCPDSSLSLDARDTIDFEDLLSELDVVEQADAEQAPGSRVSAVTSTESGPSQLPEANRAPSFQPSQEHSPMPAPRSLARRLLASRLAARTATPTAEQPETEAERLQAAGLESSMTAPKQTQSWQDLWKSIERVETEAEDADTGPADCKFIEEQGVDSAAAQPKSDADNSTLGTSSARPLMTPTSKAGPKKPSVAGPRCAEVPTSKAAPKKSSVMAPPVAEAPTSKAPPKRPASSVQVLSSGARGTARKSPPSKPPAGLSKKISAEAINKKIDMATTGSAAQSHKKPAHIESVAQRTRGMAVMGEATAKAVSSKRPARIIDSTKQLKFVKHSKSRTPGPTVLISSTQTPVIDLEGRPFNKDFVVVNFSSVGIIGPTRKRPRLDSARKSTVLDWQNVRLCVKHLKEDLGLRVIGVAVENLSAPDLGSKNKTIPDDIQMMCDAVMDVPEISGATGQALPGHTDERTAICAYEENCGFLGVMEGVRTEHEMCEQWLRGNRPALEMRYEFSEI